MPQLSPTLVQENRAPESFVKEGLQRGRDVLLSGPFKKFQTKFRAHCIAAFYSKTAPWMESSGANQRHKGSIVSQGREADCLVLREMIIA
jgi:hypothetical protein